MTTLAAVYIAGVFIGAFVTDGSPVTKVGVALAWPVGPIALAVTLSGLFLASLIAFPRWGAAVVLAGAAGGWLARTL